MGRITSPSLVKLVVGLIFKECPIYDKARSLLIRKFGDIDFESEELDFDKTDYYEKEFGKGLKKKFVSFKKLIKPEHLAAIKVVTNSMESRFICQGSRKVNLDPGYLDLAKFVLATTKDFAHRIYLGKGIYAEITLSFREKDYKPMEWTYPDYKTDAYRQILIKIRDIYNTQIKK